jgi:hypothetical protein
VEIEVKSHHVTPKRVDKIANDLTIHRDIKNGLSPQKGIVVTEQNIAQ